VVYEYEPPLDLSKRVRDVVMRRFRVLTGTKSLCVPVHATTFMERRESKNAAEHIRKSKV
jgi:hypothetical protein